MKASIAFVSVLSLVGAAVAQTTIQVGAEANSPGGIFQFSPSSVNITEGSVVTFEFSGAPGNHTVTQSSFASPCQPLEGGFDSGWIFVPGPGQPTATWNLTITNATTPIWFFCKQLAPAPHCTAGMVGAINAPGSGAHTFAAFQQAAEKSSGTPGQSEGGLVGVGASASAGPGPLSGSVKGFGIPTGASAASGSSPSATTPAGGSSSSGSASGTAASPSNTSGASNVAVNGVLALVAAALGIATL
ncbi:hypothetical protein PUNSTDRAFT_54447 [Punctularia strigosozonata HHB-11173 SS5]|uniref:uncharacterized protein n=1 Tax=Punctularia strigosozonata (strain HHB-11173) TaxID=741275 RepID=UPI00044171BF|nr:uncharacterized protein PUNSTDRAFT_54447 [Punctularia strigosozonata HHB-11173 SS5]EIN06156.1 hypothetical protein PUNSTDRAFT_54447 [Punctularia strigosozonata HHB-11173 SS5]